MLKLLQRQISVGHILFLFLDDALELFQFIVES